MKRAFIYTVPVIFVVLAEACRKPYNPPPVAGNASYLVVEGVINPGSDSTMIQLSRTVPISSQMTLNPVTGATVKVVSDQNNSYTLTETGGGVYISAGLNLDLSHKYYLSITTQDGKQYQSDPEPAIVTPPIDSIGFNITSKPDTGVQVYVNTHDPSGTIKYFRWDFTENWEFHSEFISEYISDGTALVPRSQAQDVSICYAGDKSSDIVLGSSAKLKTANIYQSPLVFLPSSSEKIEDRYRVVVHQYALTADAYNFWQLLRTNTEQLGSIFDAQPSQAPGNIHCISNPAEPVVGYVSVCTVSSKIYQINQSALPAWVPAYPGSCLQAFITDSHTLEMVIEEPDAFLATTKVAGTYLYTTRYCADCTNRGSLTPPSFWK